MDAHSQWLVGSVSKVFTDWILIASGIDGNRRVVEFFPELRGGGGSIEWEEIRLRDLGDHLGGIPPNCESSSFLPCSTVTLLMGLF